MKSLLYIFILLFTCVPSIYAAETHPLRPFPGNPAETTDASFLTPYCASRPTAVQPNTFDKRNDYITLRVQGDLTSDFSEFITPLLSITNPEKEDYDLDFEQKAKRYLADYLEGRSYYEPEAEIQNPNLTQQQDLLSRMGVFRKLAPATYQDKLRRTLIQRGHGDFQTLEELEVIYGFKPSSVNVNPNTPVQFLTINDFYENWAPLPEEFDTWDEYQRAYENWANCNQDRTDCSQWYTLWPYVPLFTREDSVGQITTFDEPGQTSNPTTITQVHHPHLARTYEVVSSLSNLLSPWEESPIIQDPQLPSNWITPAPWNQDPYWIDSGQNLPPDSGTVCDPQNTLVMSSGDLALDSYVNTSVFKELVIRNPRYDPNCAVWVDIPNLPDHGGGGWDYSNCYFTIDVRFSPTSLRTRTPFLAEITDRLTTGRYALFNIFRSTEEIQNEPPENFPGVGYEEEENPTYSFSNGSAEAGNRNSGTTAKYYYKYLGWIQCQKEKLLARLSPADTYVPFATECSNLPSGFDENNNEDDKNSKDGSLAGLCALANEYNFDCEILKAFKLLETGTGEYEYSCNSQGYCGAFQVAGGLQLGLGIPLDKFKTPLGNAEAAIRQMQMRMCQADGGCNNSKWDPAIKDKYYLEPGEFDKAAYYHYGSDQPDEATQKRWGEGKSYSDAIEYVVNNEELPSGELP
jgi:hypothetical protein